ncbi:hypothetical protein PY093_20415 [Cytobacillus sp. S13-E01]|uniref:hypothetical protein n=1 Tax=Cytobacillus sp. S13-E01 TaxID=3031326 RepID=UPI0023D80AC6|nr:hypothetical protein [Cytobacillus sp. S13-E01]MDF0728980.1 hypothetical protein [Cytobacillus sp. S13-E01]
MKTNKSWLLFLAIITIVFSAGCYADGGKVTTKDVLKRNADADIIQYNNGNVYSNVTNLEWFQEEKSKYSKVKYVGEIIKQTKSSFMFKDFYATKLPVGSKIYSTDEDVKLSGILIVEHEGEDLYYMRLLEG